MDLTRELVLGAKDLIPTPVLVPEWLGTDGKPGEVFITGGTAEIWDFYEQSLYVRKEGPKGEVILDRNTANARARLVVLCLVNREGTRLFQDKDADALGKKSAVVVDRLYQLIRKAAGKDAEGMARAEKNSEGTPKESSSVA